MLTKFYHIALRLLISLPLLFFVNIIAEKLTDYLYTRGFKLMGVKTNINDMDLFLVLFLFGVLGIVLLNCVIKFNKK